MARPTNLLRIYSLGLALSLVLLAGCGGAQTGTSGAATTGRAGATAAEGTQPQSTAASGATATAANNGVAATNVEYKQQTSSIFSFDYPTTWQISPLENAPSDAYVLLPAGRDKGTNISVIRTLGKPNDIADLEGRLLDKFNNTKSFTARTLKGTQRLQVAGQDAVAIRFDATTASGVQHEGILTGTIMPNGEVLEITMGVYPDDRYDAFEPIYNHMLSSVKFK